MNKKYYAVIQNGISIFGIGDSKESAIEDAKEWVDEPERLEGEIVNAVGAMHGDMICVECTKRLHDAVLKDGGGDVLFDENYGIYDLIEDDE